MLCASSQRAIRIFKIGGTAPLKIVHWWGKKALVIYIHSGPKGFPSVKHKFREKGSPNHVNQPEPILWINQEANVQLSTSLVKVSISSLKHRTLTCGTVASQRIAFTFSLSNR
jgi:hypothetical protein